MKFSVTSEMSTYDNTGIPKDANIVVSEHEGELEKLKDAVNICENIRDIFYELSIFDYAEVDKISDGLWQLINTIEDHATNTNEET